MSKLSPEPARGLELKIPPVVWWLLGVVLMGLLSRYWPWAQIGQSGAGVALALAVSFNVLGLWLGVAAVWKFRQAATTVHPMQLQRSSQLVQQGVFRYSRNPMYLAMLLSLAGVACGFATLSAWLVLPAFALVIQQWQIKPEERWMRHRFGEAYCQYQQQVRRWL